MAVGFNKDKQRIETRYDTDYTLRLAINNIATAVMECPNCGAPIDSTSLTHCRYCDVKIIKDTILNWEFASIKEK